MVEDKPAAERAKDEGEVVYRRTPSLGEEKGQSAPRTPPTEWGIAPMLTPLISGFALLLVLIFVLGHLSVSRLEDVSRKALDLEHRQAVKLSLLLQLRVALTKLNNEARAKAEAEARRRLMPPFDVRLRNARNDVRELLRKLENPALLQMEKWRSLHGHLAAYVEVTEDLDRYSLEGFEKFRTVDAELDEILSAATGSEQEEIFQQSERMQQQAARTIRLWNLAALLIGLFVAAATIWEVQRRFRQMRQSMDEAKRERQFSTQMLEGMVSAVAAIDAHDRIRSANSAFFRLFPEAETGASVHDKFASPGVMKMLEATTASRVEQSTYRGRWRCDASDPHCANRTFDVYSSPLEMNGERGQIVTLVDVTEAVEAEAVLRRTESLAAVGQATAQVAHEIKNPLGSIRLGISMLRDSTTDRSALNTIDLVERGIIHLNKLVIDVTQFSRQKPLERSEADLHELIEASLELVSDQIREKSAPIEKHFSHESLHGEWDVDQLRQVFVNLLDNAIDASEERSPINITTERVISESGNGHRGAGTGHLARITITDHGSGMDEETRARIFEPFFTTKKRGTGLGLAIVKQIIEQHDGTISVGSTPGQGTRFTIDLPL